ncbi:MAG: SigE family RNA polymerase sigma factor [Actinomycetes bacterium]
MKASEEVEFTAFVREHGDGLLRYARLLVPDAVEAEDLIQTALLRLSRRWSDGLDSPVAYMRTTLVNLAKDGARRRHLVPRPVAVIEPNRPEPDSDMAEAIAARERLDTLLAALPPKQRATVVLRIVDGLSEAETAKVLGCSPGTVKSNLARGLDKVRENLPATLTAPEEGSA